MFMVLRTLLVSVCLFNSTLVTGKYSYVCVNEGACHLSLLFKKKKVKNILRLCSA